MYEWYPADESPVVVVNLDIKGKRTNSDMLGELARQGVVLPKSAVVDLDDVAAWHSRYRQISVIDMDKVDLGRTGRIGTLEAVRT